MKAYCSLKGNYCGLGGGGKETEKEGGTRVKRQSKETAANGGEKERESS